MQGAVLPNERHLLPAELLRPLLQELHAQAVFRVQPELQDVPVPVDLLHKLLGRAATTEQRLHQPVQHRLLPASKHFLMPEVHKLLRNMQGLLGLLPELRDRHLLPHECLHLSVPDRGLLLGPGSADLRDVRAQLQVLRQRPALPDLQERFCSQCHQAVRVRQLARRPERSLPGAVRLRVLFAVLAQRRRKAFSPRLTALPNNYKTKCFRRSLLLALIIRPTFPHNPNITKRFYLSDTTCLSCPAECNSCNPDTTCIDCSDNVILEKTALTCQCKNGLYYNRQTATCGQCLTHYFGDPTTLICVLCSGKQQPSPLSDSFLPLPAHSSKRRLLVGLASMRQARTNCSRPL